MSISPRGSIAIGLQRRPCSIDSTGELIHFVARTEHLATHPEMREYIINSSIGDFPDLGPVVNLRYVRCSVTLRADIPEDAADYGIGSPCTGRDS